MSLNPLAPTFLPHYRSPSDPLISLRNSTTMSLPVAQLFSGMLQPIIPSHDHPINQPITDGTFILPLIQPTSQSKQDAAAHPPPPGSSSLLSSPLQHQANCLQAFHKTIQQFNQHLKAEHFDRQTIQLIVPQLQNDFALLRYLLFSQVETISDINTAVKNSATCPLTNPNPNTNPNPTSSAFSLPALVNQNFVVLPRWAPWDHPERKRTILQMPIFSSHPTCKRLLQLRLRTSDQESPNSKKNLQMN